MKPPKAWRDPFGTEPDPPGPLTLRDAIVRLTRLVNDCDDLILELERDEPAPARPPRVATVH